MSDSQPMTGPGRSFKIADIAREAGVSTATVDRVLNHRGGVRQPKRDLVLEVARRLNYPLALASCLRCLGLKHPRIRFPAADAGPA